MAQVTTTNAGRGYGDPVINSELKEGRGYGNRGRGKIGGNGGGIWNATTKGTTEFNEEKPTPQNNNQERQEGRSKNNKKQTNIGNASNSKTYVGGAKPATNQIAATNEDLNLPRKTILGMKKKTFYIVLAIIIIAALWYAWTKTSYLDFAKKYI